MMLYHFVILGPSSRYLTRDCTVDSCYHKSFANYDTRYEHKIALSGIQTRKSYVLTSLRTLNHALTMECTVYLCAFLTLSPTENYYITL